MQIGGKPEKKGAHVGLVIGFVVFALLYTWFVFQNRYRTVSDNPLIQPVYYLSDSLIATTIIVPYVVAWLLGSLAASNILSYSHHAPGSIYRLFLKRFAIGSVLVISLSAFLQVISQFSEFWATLGLGSILILIYVILLVLLVGYGLIASGARRLARIEEVV